MDLSVFQRSAPWLLLGFAGVAQLAPAQDFSVRPDWSRERGHIALLQAARDAATDQLVLIVASHPDDRHVMPAAYLRFARGWRVAILLLTRGEGGQNSKGPEIGDELGWRRTLESEACGALIDADMWYLNRQDAGFCRTAAEAIELWGRDETVLTMARLIRRIRPDVVLTTHDPDEEHGHDLALLELLPEAIALAEDSDVELAGLPAVSVDKVFRGAAADEDAEVRDLLPMEDEDRARGTTYRELAYAALKQHQTQEPIRPMEQLFEPNVPLFPMRPRDRARPEGWTLTDGLTSLFADAATEEARDLKRSLDELVDRIGSPGSLEQEAIRLYARLRALGLPPGSDADLRRNRRLDALRRVIVHSAGFQVTAEVPPDAVAVTGQPFPLRIRVQNGGRPIFGNLRITALAGGSLELAAGENERLARLPVTQPFTVDAEYLAPPDASNRRQWLTHLFGGDTFEPPIRLRCDFTVIDPVSGEVEFDLVEEVVVPADLRPAVELQVMPRALLLPRDKSTATLAVTVTRHTDEPLDAILQVLGRPGFFVGGSSVHVEMTEGKFQDFQFHLRVPEGLKAGVYNLHVLLGSHRAVIPVHKVDVRVSEKLSVGLVRGVDDNVESVLRSYVGGRFDVLDEEGLALRSLDDFDTIVVDIRALRERPGSKTWKAARAAFPRLLAYVNGGGRLVVFYHKDTEFNPEPAGFVGAPYPLRIGKYRVTREDVPIEVLRPNHPLLNYPNKIHPEDWDGWVQERGLYFPEDYAPEYQEIIAMGDPDYPPSRAAMLYARHGEGEYIYCALALYRQLDSLHPGACRILANLVSR